MKCFGLLSTVCFVAAVFYSINGINGENFCLSCNNYIPSSCKTKENRVLGADANDTKQFIPPDAQFPADSSLYNCLGDDYAIKGQLKLMPCVFHKTHGCNAISSVKPPMKMMIAMACKACAMQCKCEFDPNGIFASSHHHSIDGYMLALCLTIIYAMPLILIT